MGQHHLHGTSRAAGAQDYLLEGSSARYIIDTIRNVANGKSPAPSTRYGKVQASMRDRSLNSAVNLTPRELQVRWHIGYGLSNDEIARSMGISVEAIIEHVQSILRKMVLKARTQVAVWAVREGFV